MARPRISASEYPDDTRWAMRDDEGITAVVVVGKSGHDSGPQIQIHRETKKTAELVAWLQADNSPSSFWEAVGRFGLKLV